MGALVAVGLVSVGDVAFESDSSRVAVEISREPAASRPQHTNYPTATLDFPMQSVPAGARVMTAVVVENDTGAPVEYIGCGGPFVVQLSNRGSQKGAPPLQNMCRTPLTIPEGRSSYPVEINTSLPVGDYRPDVFALGNLVVTYRQPSPIRIVPAKEIAPSRTDIPVATLDVPRRTLRAGAMGSAIVTVDNTTGAPVAYLACGRSFQVALSNRNVREEPGWFSCGRQTTLPVGRSIHVVAINTRHSSCSYDESSTASRCLPGGRAPLLPAGDYRLELFAVPDLGIELPPPIEVRLLPARASR
jgi:hypothetical protein